MTQVGHSPTPWLVGPSIEYGDCYEVRATREELEAACGFAPYTGQAGINAAFIETAVNAHDALVKALKAITPARPTCANCHCEDGNHSNGGEPDRGKRCYLCMECPDYRENVAETQARAALALVVGA